MYLGQMNIQSVLRILAQRTEGCGGNVALPGNTGQHYVLYQEAWMGLLGAQPIRPKPNLAGENT
jgi:hypothetical protein